MAPTADTPPTTDDEDRASRARTEPMTVRPLRDGRYVVETEGGTYVVDLDARECTCPDHAVRGATCKHLRRVAIDVTEDRVPAPTGGRLVSDFATNADFGGHEPVVRAVYLDSLRPGEGVSTGRRYTFPVSRLVPVDPADG